MDSFMEGFKLEASPKKRKPFGIASREATHKAMPIGALVNHFLGEFGLTSCTMRVQFSSFVLKIESCSKMCMKIQRLQAPTQISNIRQNIFLKDFRVPICILH